MAVESNFAASLLSNLKLEDPWLPPSSWESIPSESGHGFHRSLPSSDNRLHHQVSSVSEASMVRLAMNALQGVHSALISIENISTAFCSDAADRTIHRIPSLWNWCSSTHAQGKILKSIGCSGSLVFLLCRFVDFFGNPNWDDKNSGIQNHIDGEGQREEHPPYSLVNHAFSVAVGKILEGYMCALDTLYASVNLRHISGSVEFPLEACSSVGCLTSVVHSETTMLELYLHTKELRTQIESLGNICNLSTVSSSYPESSFENLIRKSVLEFPSFFRGGELLTYLYTQLQVADPPHHELLKFLFVRSCEPYCGFIRSWIYKAEINDPYKEFAVEHWNNSPFQGHGSTDMSPDLPIASIRVRDGVPLPCFLQDYLIPLVRAGQQLQVLMKLLEFRTYVASEDLTYKDLLPSLNGSSRDHSAVLCPIIFDKNEIEARTLQRGTYFKMMQEKLRSLLTKLEFRYQQVISHGTNPNIFGHGWKSLGSPICVNLNKILIHPSAEKKRDGGDTYSEDSDTVDDILHASTAYESSECSLSSDGEDGTLSDQLIDLSSHMAGIEKRYLSGLSFSTAPLYNTSKENPFDVEELHNAGHASDRHSEGRETLNHYQPSQTNGMLLDQIVKPFESEEPHWPVSGLWKSSLAADRCYKCNLRSNFCECHTKPRKLGALEEGFSYYKKMIVTDNTLQEEQFCKDQQGNKAHKSDLFALNDWKVASNNNFLSMNPMLTKNTFLELQTDQRERDGSRAQLLPYFDFSVVEDPCKGSLEQISAGSSASTSVINSGLCEKDKHDEETLINRTQKCDYTSLLKPIRDNHGDVLPPISGGSSWESLLAKSSNTAIKSVGNHRDSSVAKFNIPLDFIIDKCLLQEIMLQYKYISKLTIKLLEEGFGFKEHLLALRRYHFMEFADWADLFIITLSKHKWCITEADHRLDQIQGFLELSIQRSSCEYDHNKDRLYVYMKGDDTLPLTTSAIGLHSFNFLGLGYRVDWPVSIVLTAGALKIYSEIFSFLIKLKLAMFSLTDVWGSLKDLRPLISQNQRVEQCELEVLHFNSLMKMRHQVNHFVTALQQYVESQLSHVSWCRFLHSLQHKVKDMMDLESVHMAYLVDSLQICFLSDETQDVARIIDGILQCALDFRSCLRGGVRDVDINQGDRATTLSRVDISKVFSITKTFDKNLRELHINYLKSPKYGAYGLSRFWGYLNYNEYYSDIGNARANYAFSL